MRYLAALLMVSTMCVTSVNAADKSCLLKQLGDLPATMSGTAALIPGTINGASVRFLVDSGAFFSIVTRETAQKLQLREGPLPYGLTLVGIGGGESGGLVTTKQFSLAGLLNGHEFTGVQFIVSAKALGDADGVIGQNILRIADTEYDLANGKVRLMQAENCSDHALAYWHGTNSVAEMHIQKTSPESPHWISDATINGRKIRVLFDSGASRSVLNSATAEKVGIKPETEGVEAAGVTSGFGPKTVEIVYARFNTLDLGGELIKNARLFVGDLSRLGNADLLLGADFFLSHRLYFSAKQNRLYFTYNGGPVFDLRSDRSSNAENSKPVVGAADIATEAVADDEKLSAADLRRRGTASMSRGDLKSAMGNFNRAVTRDPNDAESYYERSRAYAASKQLQPAIVDVDQALKIKPDYIDALLLRGAFRLAQKDQSAAQADFDAVLRLDPHDSGNALTIGRIYAAEGLHTEAISRFTIWIETFAKDSQLPTVLNNRCWERAIVGEQLDLALADCNLALKKGPRNSAVLDSRAFVHLRRQEYELAITDYQAVLKLQPQQATSMYGLGLAEYKKGQTAAGEQHMHAASALAPKVAEFYNQLELVP